MSQKIVRVNLPVNNPDKTVKLCEDIHTKHTELGAGSPLDGFNMADFFSKTTSAKNLRQQAAAKHKDGEERTKQRDMLLGIAAGQNLQTTGTVAFYLTKARDILLVALRSNPQGLSLWGYDVVVSQNGGRRNVRVNIPLGEPDKLLELADLVIAKHAADGAGSPLSSINMVDFATKATDARTEHDAAAISHAQGEEFNQSADMTLGYAEGQTSLTDGTLYFYYTGMRDHLVNVSGGNEERLSPYGYDVVISEA